MEECGGVGLPSLQRGADHFVQDGEWKTAGQKTKAKANTHLVAREMGRPKRGTPWWLRLYALPQSVCRLPTGGSVPDFGALKNDQVVAMPCALCSGHHNLLPAEGQVR